MTKYTMYDKKMLLEESRAVFLKKGFVSLHEITIHTRYSQQPIYSQFGSVKLLRQAIADDIALRLTSSCTQKLYPKICPKKALLLTSKVLFKKMQLYPGLTIALISKEQSGQYLRDRIVDELYQTLIRFVKVVPTDFKLICSTILTLTISFAISNKYFANQKKLTVDAYIIPQIEHLFDIKADICIDDVFLPVKISC